MKKTYKSPMFDFFAFELTDTQTTATYNPFTDKAASVNHSLIGATEGYDDNPNKGFRFDENHFN